MRKYRHKLLGHKMKTETRLVVSAMGIYRFTHSKVLSIHISLVAQTVLYCGCIIHSQYLLPSTITNGKGRVKKKNRPSESSTPPSLRPTHLSTCPAFQPSCQLSNPHRWMNYRCGVNY